MSLFQVCIQSMMISEFLFFLNHGTVFCCFRSVPTASGKLKGSCGENYSIAELHSDDSTDDDEAPKKKIPVWAQGNNWKYCFAQSLILGTVS